MQDILQLVGSILLTLLILTFIVVIHEWGHFIVARASGVFVEEFSIGMGPRLFGFTTKKDMKFSVRLLPIGGYCKMKSRLEDELDALDKAKQIADPTASPVAVNVELMGNVAALDEEDAEEAPAKPMYGQYCMEDVSTWKRILMYLAGPLMNFVLALVLSMMLNLCFGFAENKVNYVTPYSAADEAGLEEGDVFISINGEAAYSYYKVNYILAQIQGGTSTTFVVRRDGKLVTIQMASQFLPSEERYLYGFSWSIRGDLAYEIENGGVDGFFSAFGSAIEVGFWDIVFDIESTVESLIGIITGNVSAENMSGVIGVVSVVGEVVEQTAQYGFWIVAANMANLAMILSASLGIMNLMPIPSLDGGQVVILIIEKIIGHPLSAKARVIVGLISWAILILLMIFVCYNDISKLIS